MITVGEKVRFIPSFVTTQKMMPEELKACKVTGEVVFVNYGHKMFTVQYADGDITAKESFKFCDIGEAVKICGR